MCDISLLVLYAGFLCLDHWEWTLTFRGPITTCVLHINYLMIISDNVTIIACNVIFLYEPILSLL